MKLLIVDIETSGLDRANDDILELAAATVELSTGHGHMELDTLIQPVKPYRDCWFTEHAGLTQKDFAGAPKFEDVRPQLQPFFDAYPATSYSCDFDMVFLNRYGIQWKHKWPCLMQTCTPILNLPGKYPGRPKFPSLDESCKFFFPDSPVEHGSTEHRAFADARRGARIAYALGRKGAWVGEL